MAIDDRQRALKSPLRHYTIEISPDGEVVTIELISPDGEVVDVVGSREDEPARFFGLAMWWQRLGATLSDEAAGLVDRVSDPLYEEEEDENDPDAGEQLANWSRIRRIVGPCGTYLYGSLTRLDVSEKWLRAFHAQARGQRFRAYVKDGHLYLDALE
jgi:hypothetical protein